VGCDRKLCRRTDADRAVARPSSWRERSRVVRSATTSGAFVVLGVAVLALVCCGGPLLVIAFDAAALGGVAALGHGPAPSVATTIAVATLLGVAYVVRRRKAACAPDDIARSPLR